MKNLKREKRKTSKGQLIEIGSILIIVICLMLIIFAVSSNFIEKKTDKENLDNFFEIQDKNIEIQDEVKVKEIANDKDDSENLLGVLEIKKINFIQGFYSINSRKNDINKNIQIIKGSAMPNELKGNLIIAGHSGRSKNSYFNNLNKLAINDIATVYFDGKTYDYKLVNVYEVEKTGVVNIVRNKEITTLTLITCKKNTHKQLVFIFELN